MLGRWARTYRLHLWGLIELFEEKCHTGVYLESYRLFGSLQLFEVGWQEQRHCKKGENGEARGADQSGMQSQMTAPFAADVRWETRMSYVIWRGNRVSWGQAIIVAKVKDWGLERQFHLHITQTPRSPSVSAIAELLPPWVLKGKWLPLCCDV